MTADEPVDRRGESDWDEQDLLTIDEAGGRLEQELAALEVALRQTPQGGEREALRARRLALAATLANIKAGPTDLARVD